MGTLQIDVLGTSFSIRASEDSDYLNKLLGYYKRIVTQIENAGNLKDSTQIAVLAGIMLCDEVYKEKYEQLNNQYLRLAADFENFRKRNEQEREALLKYGAENTLYSA